MYQIIASLHHGAGGAHFEWATHYRNPRPHTTRFSKKSGYRLGNKQWNFARRFRLIVGVRRIHLGTGIPEPFALLLVGHFSNPDVTYMGDPTGARGILKEVLDEGDESQQQQAQQLLDSLPG